MELQPGTLGANATKTRSSVASGRTCLRVLPSRQLLLPRVDFDLKKQVADPLRGLYRIVARDLAKLFEVQFDRFLRMVKYQDNHPQFGRSDSQALASIQQHAQNIEKIGDRIYNLISP